MRTLCVYVDASSQESLTLCGKKILDVAPQCWNGAIGYDATIPDVEVCADCAKDARFAGVKKAIDPTTLGVRPYAERMP